MKAVLVALGMLVVLGILTPGVGSAQNDKLSFTHELLLDPRPLMDGTLRFISDEEISLVRALVTIDERVLAITMRKTNNGYEVRVPSPRSSLSYQFQVVRSDGGTALTALFQANACENLKFEASQKVLQALALEQRIEMMNASLKVVEEVLR